MVVSAMTERLPVVALAAIAGLHLAWAAGSSWPAQERETLGELMAGRPDGSVPGRTACVAVAALLTSAAALVGGRPRRWPRVRRAGAAGVGAVLGLGRHAGSPGGPISSRPAAWRPAFGAWTVASTRRCVRCWRSRRCRVHAGDRVSGADRQPSLNGPPSRRLRMPEGWRRCAARPQAAAQTTDQRALQFARYVNVERVQGQGTTMPVRRAPAGGAGGTRLARARWPVQVRAQRRAV